MRCNELVSIKELSEKTMTPAKRANAKNDYFAFYIGRPLSYVLTIPFLQIGCSPNMVSFLSLFPSLIGFLILVTAKSTTEMVIGWLCFFLWNLMDGVDGNIARYTGKSSPLGALWDATSGYVAMVLTYFSMGIVAYNYTGDVIYTILGGFSAMFVIFPRLVMNKKIAMIGSKSDDLNKKENYGIARIIALNLTSISGFIQVIMLISLLYSLTDYFTIAYFIINLAIMIVSLIKLLK